MCDGRMNERGKSMFGWCSPNVSLSVYFHLFFVLFIYEQSLALLSMYINKVAVFLGKWVGTKSLYP